MRLPDFALKQLRIGRQSGRHVTFSIVINKYLYQFMTKRLGGFFTWDSRWAAGTLRFGYLAFNIDIDLRPIKDPQPVLDHLQFDDPYAADASR